MELNIFNNSVIVFDLDDTLYCEYDFILSAFKAISKIYKVNKDDIYYKMTELYEKKEDVFRFLVNSYPSVTSDKEYLISIYRNHKPSISLSKDTGHFLKKIKAIGCKTGLLTDGRSVTQRNKIKSLGLSDYFDLIIISEEFGSEKPELRNYVPFKNLSRNGQFIFIGDNPSKDFITPNKLGWLTICILDQGKNIHKQDFTLPPEYLPTKIVASFNELIC